MKDMLTTIYNQLISDEKFTSLVNTANVKFYDYPETGDTSTPFVIITPLDVPSPAAYASDQEVSAKLIYQIDVQSKERVKVKQIQSIIKVKMYDLGFFQLSDGLDTYFKETKRFVDARRYRKNTPLYDTDY